MSRTATEPVQVDVPTRLRQIESELNLIHIERTDALHNIMLCVLGRVHGFILGDPGADKSRMIENLCLRFPGANYRRALMHTQLGEESLFGQFDLPLYDQTGQWERDIAETLGDGHLCLVDEPDKAGPAALMPLLTWMNERRVKPGKLWLPANLIAAFGAANALLEPGASAIFDRWMVRFEVKYVQEKANVLRLLRSSEIATTPAPMTTVTLDELQHFTTQVVPYVKIPDGVYESIADLRFELFAEQIRPSDRRIRESLILLRAAGALRGDKEVIDDDIEILQHVFWEHPEQRETVLAKVLERTGPLTRMALEFQAQVDDINKALDELQLPGKAFDEVASYGGTANFEAGQISERLEKAIAKAADEGRSTGRLEGVRAQVLETLVRIHVDCLKTPEDRARKLVGV